MIHQLFLTFVDDDLWSFNRTGKISGQYLHALPRYINFNFSGFLALQFYFPTNFITFFTDYSLDPGKLETGGVFAIPQLVLDY